ncbi:putative serpin-Z12 [Miscanthus floridulus]|uniref:putative serpin-Z12 n=1 Tax=Miscanthus floridulus TaxID=154761 RepID=UPI00345AAB30
MSTPRRGVQHHGDERTATRAGAGSRDNDGQGAGDLGFGSMAGPWFAFAPPHPAPQRAPVFAEAPVDPFAWSMPVSFANPFDGPRPSTQNVPWGPPGEVPFASFAAGPAAPEPDWRHGRPDVFAGSGRRSVPAVVPPDLDADGGASCLPLARQAGLRAAGERNFIVSPLSFHAALALVAAGARGETQRELLGFLGSDSLDELQRAAATALVARLRDLPQTSFACGVWVDRVRALTPEFRDAAASRYAAVAESVDFASEPEAARRRVNAFVSEATKGLIDDVLPPGSVDSFTVLVLANAIYFKGTWARPFDRFRNFTAPFHLPDGATVRAPFMTTSLFKEQQVAVFPGFKALKLPYKNGGGARQAAFYMLLLLPDGEALKISDLYDKAVSTPGFIRRHTPVDEVPVGRFMVPKFKFTFEFEASGDIQKLGVNRAFRGGDFSGMVSGGNGLFISGVYHKATVEVDEVGTVAAAATAVCIKQCARMGPPPLDFVADRPFLFAIVEERSGVLLFLGHVVNPLVG